MRAERSLKLSEEHLLFASSEELNHTNFDDSVCGVPPQNLPPSSRLGGDVGLVVREPSGDTVSGTLGGAARSEFHVRGGTTQLKSG